MKRDALAVGTPFPSEDERRPPVLPPAGALAWGDDACGLWIDVDLAGVVQRFRWIEPGEFMMGSPDDEPEREKDEGPRHRVRLTTGFWLADTACTQALWRAVMGGKNPSRFQEDERNPVENVSWDEVSGFLRRLASLVPGIVAELPTEAEWEYACRAGSETPFHFGATITPERANYDGNYPYAGEKGDYRQNTVPVKTTWVPVMHFPSSISIFGFQRDCDCEPLQNLYTPTRSFIFYLQAPSDFCPVKFIG